MTQGSTQRHDSFTSHTGGKVQGMRAKVGRDYFLRLVYKAGGRGTVGQWHVVCNMCDASVLQLTKGDINLAFSWTISELLSQSVIHMIQQHQLDLTYEHYGENYA